MNTKKILLLTGAIVVGILSLGFFAIRNAVETIASNGDCGMFNLDHIELRAAVDIPASTTISCDYDEVKKRNTTIFSVDRQSLNMHDYTRRYGFVKVTSVPANFAAFDAKGISKVSKKNLYLRKGQTPTTAYSMLFDMDSGTLWSDLHYLNE